MGYLCESFVIYNKTIKEGCVFFMGNFKIPKIPMTTQKCIRFPNDIVEKIEGNIIGKDCTFSAFVIEAVRNALNDLENKR